MVSAICFEFVKIQKPNVWYEIRNQRQCLTWRWQALKVWMNLELTVGVKHCFIVSLFILFQKFVHLFWCFTVHNVRLCPWCWQPKSSGWNVVTETPAHMRSIWSSDYQPLAEPFKSTHDLQPIERPSTKGREVVARLSGLKLRSVKRCRSGAYFATLLSGFMCAFSSV